MEGRIPETMGCHYEACQADEVPEGAKKGGLLVRSRETEKHKQRLSEYFRRIGRIQKIGGKDVVPKENPSARKCFDRKPYGIAYGIGEDREK